MKKIDVNLGERSYPILIRDNLPPAEALSSLDITPQRALLVSDQNVAPLYSERWTRALSDRGCTCSRFTIPAGENSKCLAWAEQLYTAAAKAGLDRQSLIVALGGGVIGDLAGFAAATYLRGLRLIQIPTSLLAMVDSSVGGKTAVNITAGKNLVGAFHQPSAVFIDLASLDTLPEREYRSGLAEVIKYGAIADPKFFLWQEEQCDKLKSRDPGVMMHMVETCCRLKASIVGGDERDTGQRAILNFGHTLGHAIETVYGYGRWLHGEAVAAGMVYASVLSRLLSGLPQTQANRIARLLVRCGLAWTIDAEADWPSLLRVMTLDKKSVNGEPRFVLLNKIGLAVYDCRVSQEVLKQAWDTMP